MSGRRRTAREPRRRPRRGLGRLNPSVCASTVSPPSASVTLIGVPRNCIGNESPSSRSVQPRAEVQDAVADVGADVAALDEVERPGHHPHVDALLGRAALDVADVALERHEEALPRALRVQRGQDAGVGDEAQRRAVRGAPVVVLDVLRAVSGAELVAEPLEQIARSSLVGEQVEQHHRVGLLGQLVAVGIVALGPQDPVEPLDVAVPRPVGVPVELLELLVALELADDAVAVERHEHPAAHLLPRAISSSVSPSRVAQRLARLVGQQRRAPCGRVSQIHATMTFV